MKIFKLIVFVLFLSIAANAFSAPFDMIAVGDPILDDILFLSLESGRGILSFTPPFSPHEIELFLKYINTENLSPVALEAYERIEKRLNPQARINVDGDNLLFTLNIKSSLEGTARFNTNINWHPLYPKIPALLSFPVRLYFADSLQLYMEPLVSKEPEYYRGSGETFYADNDVFVGNFSHNMILKGEDIDQTFPVRAYIAMGGDWWNFQLGRDRLSFGTGQMGNLTIGDNLAYHQFARASFFSNFFRYSVLVSQMPLDTRDIFDYGDAEVEFYKTTQRYLYLHRLDVLVKNKFSISISEGVLVGNLPLELRFLNPMMVFHSMFSFWDYRGAWVGGETPPEDTGDVNGSLFSLELNYNIINSLGVYGQFVMNQFSTKYKQENWGGQPNGLGWLGGMRYSGTFGEWGFRVFLEFIYTDPYLYLNPSPFASHFQMQTLGINPGRYIFSYIGYPRDTIAATLGGRFFNGDNLVIKGELSFISRGEHRLEYNWANTEEVRKETTPSGTPENKYIASLGTAWKITSYLSLNGNVTGIFSQNNENKKGDDQLGGQISLSVNFIW